MKKPQSQGKLKLRRVMLVAKHYDEHDFSHHFKRIADLCDEHDCQLLVYALASYGNGGGQWYPPKRLLFSRSKQLQMIVLETCSWEGSGEPFTVEIWRKTSRFNRPDVHVRAFARSTDPDQKKKQFVTEFKTRVYPEFANARLALAICGELNALKVRHDGTKKVDDPFRLKRAISANQVNVVLNPWHSSCRRFEIPLKLRELSKGKRLYLSVWNKRNGPEPDLPWAAYRDGRNVIDKIKELPRPVVPARPDIRVGIYDI